MQTTLSLLWELQNLERSKTNLLAERKGMRNKDIGELLQDIETITASLGHKQTALVNLQRSNAKKEKELEFMSHESKELETKLYGNTIKSAKELEQIQKKFEEAKKELSAKEEELYMDLEKTDLISVQILDCQQKIAEKNALLKTRKQQADEWLAENQRKCKEIDAKCAAIIEKVDKTLLNQYVLLSRRLSQPIAKLENGICSGCRLGVPERQTVRETGQIVYCENCGRLLFSE